MQYQVLTKQRHLACSLHPFPQLKTLGKSAEVRENVIADARFNTRFFAIYYYLAATATAAPTITGGRRQPQPGDARQQ